MKQMLKIPFVDPISLLPLELKEDGECLRASDGTEYSIVGGIPRFVSASNYAEWFGAQWKKYRKTQLDSYTNCNMSGDRLETAVGENLSILNGKQVLEAGCGAGRFTEVLLENGAKVYATDLSEAIEANYLNFNSFGDKYIPFQSSILELPFKENQFDVVLCIGVIQHTPSPEETIEKLCKQVKSGGLLVIDHYARVTGPPSRSKRIFRKLLLKRSPKFTLQFCSVLVSCLWPLHRFVFWISKTFTKSNRGGRLRKLFMKLSPIIDHQGRFNSLSRKQQFEWALLDTHDFLTDMFKHLREPEEIRNCLEINGMTSIESYYGGNGVEARCVKS